MPAEPVDRSLAGYDAFYAALGGILDRAEAAFGRCGAYFRIRRAIKGAAAKMG